MSEDTPPEVARTVGLSPKVPAQAVVTVLAFLLGHYGIELDPALAGALATLVGAIAGVIARPGVVVRRAA